MLISSIMSLELKLASSEPLSVDQLTKKQLDTELQKGIDSIKEGNVYSADEVDAILAKEFGIWFVYIHRNGTLAGSSIFSVYQDRFIW